jgi:hypothetical protein
MSTDQPPILDYQKPKRPRRDVEFYVGLGVAVLMAVIMWLWSVLP